MNLKRTFTWILRLLIIAFRNKRIKYCTSLKKWLTKLSNRSTFNKLKVTKMQLSSNLIEDILSGNAVLFLGAGASADSLLENNEKVPLGNGLAKILYAHFYPNEDFSNEPLNLVSSMIESSFGKKELHEFLYSYLKNIRPNDSLKQLSQFKWFNIYTTNIEQGIEEAYRIENNRAQSINPIVGAMDIATENKKIEVNLFKLHGCVSRKDESLVFSLEEYATSKEERLKLFTYLTADLIERPVVFIGYSMADSNFQELWQTVKKYCRKSALRNRYYYVGPYLKESNRVYLQNEGFEVYNGTGHEFGEALMHKTRGERKSLDDFYVENIKPASIFENLSLDVQKKYQISQEYDFPKIEVAHPYPITQAFFNGVEPTWGDIKYERDAERDLLSELNEAFENWYQVQKFDFWLITGKSGDGKSTLLKRFAYELSLRLGDVVLFAQQRGEINPEIIASLAQQLNHPIVVFVDNVVDRMVKVNRLIKYLKAAKAKVLIIGATRSSDWHVHNTEFAFKPVEFKLNKLTDDEIGRIIKKLEVNAALGYIEDLGEIERFNLFREKSDRELLVALLEITKNKNFDEIIANEYAEIQIEDAQNAYLLVCFINQFQYKIPQSLLVRMLDFNLTTLYESVFRFTNDIIYAEPSKDGYDYLLKARHPVIAKTVVDIFLNDEVAKFDVLQRLLRAHIPSNSLEKSLVKMLYHHTTVRALFNNIDTGIRCYELLSRNLPDDYYLLQQKAIFLSDYKSDYEAARHSISQAISLSPYLSMLQNTQGTIILKQALDESNKDKSRYLMEEGKNILKNTIRRNYKDNSYNYHSLINHLMSWYRKFDRKDNSVLEEIQTLLLEASRSNPSDHMILTEYGKLNNLLDKTEHAVDYFQKALTLNPRNSIARYFLCRIYSNTGKSDEAFDICKKGVYLSVENFFLNRLFFELLHRRDVSVDEIKDEYVSIIRENNDDYLKLMFACYLYTEGDEECDKYFSAFRSATNIPYDEKFFPRNEIMKIINKEYMREIGVVKKEMYSGYLLKTERFSTGTLVYASKRKFNGVIGRIDRLEYTFSFNYMGPVIEEYILL